MGRMHLFMLAAAFCIVCSCAIADTAEELYGEADARFSAWSQQEYMAMVNGSQDPTTKLPADLQRKVLQNNRLRQILLEAARSRYQPGIGYTLSAHTNPPLYFVMDRAYRFLLCDAKARLHRGDIDDALRSIKAVYGIADQYSSDAMHMSSNKVNHIVEQADRYLKHIEDIGEMRDHRAVGMLHALAPLHRADPTGAADGAMVEAERYLEWCEDQFASDDYEGVENLLDMISDPPVSDLEFGDYSEEELAESLESARDLATTAADIFSGDEGSEQKEEDLKKLLADAQQDPLMAAMTQWDRSMLNVEWSKRKSLGLLEGRIEALEAIAEGRVGLAESANGAFWYKRAADEFLQIPLEHWADVLDSRAVCDPVPIEQTPSEASTALQHAAEAMKIIDEALAIQECDFTMLRGGAVRMNDPFHITPSYTIAIMNATSILQRQAMHCAHDDELEHALANLDACMAMIGHLCSDDLLISSVIANECFLATLATAEVIVSGNQINDEQRAHLLQALQRVGPADPFSYAANIKTLREALPRQLTELADENSSMPDADPVATQMTAEQLAWALLLIAQQKDKAGFTQLFATKAVEEPADANVASDIDADTDTIALAHTRKLIETLCEERQRETISGDLLVFRSLLLLADAEELNSWATPSPLEIETRRRQVRQHIRTWSNIFKTGDSR